LFTPDPALAAQVFPPGHRNPTPSGRYNLVVIGGGTAGLVCAAGAAGLGAKVALIERRALGGDCLNVGCVPSKALIKAAHAAHAVREAASFGVRARLDGVDWAAVMAHVRGVRQAISPHDSVSRFQSLGVDVFLGQGRFVSREAIDVGGTPLTFARAVIATGGRPVLPDVPGLREAAPLTNETIFEIDELPPRLVVIGGGPVGCELAQALARLGSEVTLVQRGATLLGREPAAIAAMVQASLEADGIRVVTSAQVTRVEVAAGARRVTIAHPGGEVVVEASHILVAAGRQPNVEDLDLPRAGVAWTTRGVTVDTHLRTANPAIYAAGDVCLPQRFTHAADASARAVVQNALFLGRKQVSSASIPRCTYTDPEVAVVGETPADDPRLQTFAVGWDDVDRARTDGERAGGVWLYARRGRVVGGTIVGRQAGDLVGEVAVLASQAVSLSALAGIVHPYPTRAEAIRKAGDLYNRARLTPTVRGLFNRWLAWRR
jgi:pyruvate/2-oxoglutarate dehydrogenase complex dihydrolipoamide dehydrogenase (E3) component